MDAAKKGVTDFLHRHGKHDTTVHENFAPAVTNETVNQERHNHAVTAIDKEVHQDHYHTTVQPVHDNKVLPEQHHYNTTGVEHRKFEHGNDEEVERRLRAEREKFKDTTVKGETRETHHSSEPVVGEHIHHHVHENIQPVVNRQTVEPHVVHTTVPIHEVHHSAAQHHNTSALPAMSMADFQKQGGSLGGREQRTDFFEGEPRSMSGHTPHRPGDSTDQFRNTGHVQQHPHGTSGGVGSGLAGGAAAGVAGAAATRHHNKQRRGSSSSSSSSDSDRGTSKKKGGLTGALTGNRGTTGTTNHTGTTGLTGSTGTANHTGTTGHAGTHGHTGTDGIIGNKGTTAGTTGTTGTTGHNATSTTGATSHTKPSLLDRLNPMKDTDGDGKKGFMD